MPNRFGTMTTNVRLNNGGVIGQAFGRMAGHSGIMREPAATAKAFKAVTFQPTPISQ